MEARAYPTGHPSTAIAGQSIQGSTVRTLRNVPSGGRNVSTVGRVFEDSPLHTVNVLQTTGESSVRV